MALGYPRAGGTQGVTCSAFEVMTLSKRSFGPNVPMVGVNMNWPRISSVCDLSELAGTSGTRENSTNTSSKLKLN